MTASELGFLLTGAFCVALGVVCGALADRIRRSSSTSGVLGRRRAPRESDDVSPGQITRASVRPYRAELDRRLTDAELAMADDVAAALVTAGYPKIVATAAVGACAGSERSTLEAWTRAALRRANARQGAAS